MLNTTPFSWKKRALSFKYAVKGLTALFRYEHNARIHLAVALLAIIAGVWLEISPLEWCLVVGCIVLVLAGEAFNSAVEALADEVSAEFSPLIGRAKDLGAAAVLLLAAGAVIIGLIIFLPKILSLLTE
ncbi:MAG: diacylglycerol kinase family protein [Muribaculaceae bacterium]|nr:diacylglycerol kinase family protein [Muribaculaceae bacterium]